MLAHDLRRVGELRWLNLLVARGDDVERDAELFEDCAALWRARGEHQWRGSGDEQALREPDIETLYTSVDPDEVLTLLDKYGISYVYVGPLERERYPAPGLAKFAEVMQVVYDIGPVTIYRR